MKIDELKRIAEENNYEFSKELGYFCFKKRNHTNYIKISRVSKNKIWISNPNTCYDKDFNMIKASFKFAETPIDERVEEKKYYLKHRWIGNFSYGEGYLNLFLFDNIMRLSSVLQDSSVKTQFTLKEIDEIKEKYNTDLSDFEKKEVEE